MREEDLLLIDSTCLGKEVSSYQRQPPFSSPQKKGLELHCQNKAAGTLQPHL